METKRIYMDNAATTYLKKEVMEEMYPYFTEIFANSNSQHYFGRQAGQAVDKARATVAKILGCQPLEVYFTSGGSESDNWAIKGMASARGKGHIISSKIEHPAVINALNSLDKSRFEVTLLDVDEFGVVDVKQLEKAIKEDTILISVMAANNEVGTLQPIEKIAKIAKSRNIPFHTDAVQAMGVMDFDVKKMGIDMLSLSAHKFYGPKGIGVLYIRNGLKLGKLINGGEQERSMRAGTTNVPAVVGLARALELSYSSKSVENARLAKLRDKLIKNIEQNVPHIKVNGHRTNRLPNNANISFEFIEGESILLMLDIAGIAVSTGSACSSGSLKSSAVLMAMGLAEELAHGSVRFTLGEQTTDEDVEYVAGKVCEVVKKLREMSPLFAEKSEIKSV